MAKHEATIRWRASGGFTDGSYSRAHSWHFEGGAVVPASSSPGIVPLPLSDPAGVDPEEALIASAASCHMLWFLSLAQGAGLDVASYTDQAAGTLEKMPPASSRSPASPCCPRSSSTGASRHTPS